MKIVLGMVHRALRGDFDKCTFSQTWLLRPFSPTSLCGPLGNGVAISRVQFFPMPCGWREWKTKDIVRQDEERRLSALFRGAWTGEDLPASQRQPRRAACRHPGRSPAEPRLPKYGRPGKSGNCRYSHGRSIGHTSCRVILARVPIALHYPPVPQYCS